MRGQRNVAIAVRDPDGQVHVSTKPASNVQSGIRRVPFLRGIVALFDSLIIGIQALFESANISVGEENQKISGPLLWGTVVVSIAFSAAVFFVIPLLITDRIDQYVGSTLLSNLIEGIIRVAIFVLYLALINLIPEIRSVFAYHGAEHKTINAYEHNVPLEPEPVARFSTAHVRCGTSFLFAVMIIAILVFSLVGHTDIWVRISSRILLIPVIAAIAYEFTRWSAKQAENRIVRVLLLPGLALQKMTTRQPNSSQIEVAVSALKAVIEADKRS